MKHGKKATRAQKIKLNEFKLNSDNWLVIQEDVKSFIVQNKKSRKIRVLKKEN